MSFMSFFSKAEQLIYFDITEKNANQALINFAQQSQQTLLFSFELATIAQSTPIKGYYSTDFALRKLLRNSGLTFSKNNDGVIAIIADESPVEKLIAVTTNDNRKQNIPPAQVSIEKIAIVGSRTARRSIIDLPVPVDILSFQQLKQSGQTDIGNMLQAVAPSFNFSKSAISDGSDVLQPATLRGLGPDQTLVLVNGKRRHQASLIHINNSVGRGTAGTDLNAIPLAAIKRIEILRDGAAAQYGSDAIAGVINLVLKDDTAQDYVEMSYGQYGQGDGASQQLEFNKTFSLLEQGFINTSLSISDFQATNRAGQDGACIYQDCISIAPEKYFTSSNNEITANRQTFEIGNPKSQQQAVVINAGYPLALGELYGFASYSKRDNTSAAFFRTARDNSTNPQLQDGQATVNNGYLPKIATSIKDMSVNLGYAFDLDNGTAIDASYTYGKNSLNYWTKNSINASYANFLRYHEAQAADDIRTTIPRTAHAYDLSLSLQTLNLDIMQDLDWATLAVGFELRRDHYQVEAGEKYSYFDYNTLDNQAQYNHDAIAGIQGFPGIAPDAVVDEQRYVRSAYLELEQQLSSDISLNSALRYDDYDDFGASTNLKVAAYWQSNNWLTYRAAFNTGFRAPSMQQLYFNNTSTQFLVNNDGQLIGQKVATFRNDSNLARSIGISKLTEESSKNLSLGAVASLSNGLTITFDYYHISIDDRIVLSSSLCSGENTVLDQALMVENVDKAQVFLNGIDSTTQGVDLIATWQYPIFQGVLDLTLAANFTDTKVSQLFTPKSSALNNLPVEQVFSQHDIAIIESWQPKNRINFNINYQQKNWLFNLTFNRFGQYSVLDGDKQTYSAKLLTDVRAEYHINESTKVYFGSNNLFDVYPDKNTIGNSRQGQIVDDAGNTIVDSDGVFEYSRRSAPFGYNGAYFYAGIALNF
ncbi:TonB-dependent receptor [Colwellia sp. M166]|nr:TonB-dependent receptor [Colwellia sp. M166]